MYKTKATITSALVTSSAAKRGMDNSTYYLLNIQYIIHTGTQYSGQTVFWKKNVAGEQLP